MLQSILSLTLDGISLGCIYALIALGYTMVYGVIKLINFAHGEFYMMGAYAGVGVVLALGGVGLGVGEPYRTILIFLLAMTAGAMAAGVIAVVVEKVAYKPLRRSTRIAALLTALGVSLFLQNVALKAFSPTPRAFPAAARIADRRYPRIALPAAEVKPGSAFQREVCYTDREGREHWLGGGFAPIDARGYDEAISAGYDSFYCYPAITVQRKQIIVWGMVLALTLALYVLVRYSKMGKAMRAVSYDFEAAELMGINVNRVISFTFFVGALLAGAGGVLVGAYYGQIKPGMGVMYGLKAFVAAVIGGIGSIGGAVLGGLALGVAESLVQLSSWTAPFRDALSFAVLILILVFLPRGFFGKEEREKYLMETFFFRFANDFVMISIYLVLALSLNLINGYAGLFSLGHAGFWAVGAYAGSAFIVYAHLAAPALPGVVLFGGGVIVAIAAAAAAGLVIGLPCLRLEGDYLAIATLGFSLIVINVVNNIPAVGGAVSFPMGGLSWPSGSLYDLSARVMHNVVHMGLGLAAVVLTTVVIRNIRHSTHGRAIVSMREDDMASQLCGINTVKYKLFVFVLGAGFAGIAGVLYATYVTRISTEAFSFMEGVKILLMVVLGGMGSLSGTFVAVILLYEIPEVLRLSFGNYPVFGYPVADWWVIVYALILITLMILRPEGLLGNRELSDIRPFSRLFGRAAAKGSES